MSNKKIKKSQNTVYSKNKTPPRVSPHGAH